VSNHTDLGCAQSPLQMPGLAGFMQVGERIRVANEGFDDRRRRIGSVKEIEGPAIVVVSRQGWELMPSVGYQEECERDASRRRICPGGGPTRTGRKRVCRANGPSASGVSIRTAERRGILKRRQNCLPAYRTYLQENNNDAEEGHWESLTERKVRIWQTLQILSVLRQPRPPEPHAKARYDLS